jgi:hypothetical protein
MLRNIMDCVLTNNTHTIKKHTGIRNWRYPTYAYYLDER